MSHLIRTISSNLIRKSYYPSFFHVRTAFSSAGIGLDNFQLSRDQYKSRYNSSIESFRKRFIQSVQQGNSEIFREDLRSMILIAETDNEVLSILEALKKYNQSKLKLSDYNFGCPLMRLLYSLNKTDLAMKIFVDEKNAEIFDDVGSTLILMNKLIDEKRYDDALNIFELACQRGFSTANNRKYPSDIVLLAIDALFRQNTKESLKKTKEIIILLRENGFELNPRMVALTATLSIQQNEPSFAMEVLTSVRLQDITTLRNIRAICYADMDRVEEAISIVHLLADQPPIDNDRRRIFPLVLKHIEEAAKRSNNPDLSNRFEDISKFVTQNNRLSKIDLVDFLNEPIHRRTALNSNRNGTQQSQNQNGSTHRQERSRGNISKTDQNTEVNRPMKRILRNS